MTASKSESLFRQLWFRVLLGLVLGIMLGFIVGPMTADSVLGVDGNTFLTSYIKPVGTVFISLIKMVIIPLIFFSLVNGIISMTDAEAFKRIGTKSVVVFMITGAVAVCIGLGFGYVFAPGDGINLNALSELSGGAKAVVPKEIGVVELLVGIIPTNIIYAMANDEILQVVVFAIFVGITMNKLGHRIQNLIDLFNSAAVLVFRMIEMVVQFAPYGVFALTAWMVGTQGMAILEALVVFVLTVLGALALQYVLFGVMLLVFGRLSPFPFYKKMLDPQILAFSTTSSKASLATAMRVINEKIGVSESSTAFVLPLGTSINMVGTAIYLGICTLFFAQAYGIELEAYHYFVLILTATLGSVGAAGIPSGSLFMMGMVFTSVGVPLEGIALIAGVDRLLDMFRTATNITGDSVVTVLVDKSEHSFDEDTYYS